MPNSIFYYPYASFTDRQAPLLKAAALYFDAIYILDPLKASWGGIGPGEVAADVQTLEHEGILKRVAPEEVLSRMENAIAEAIRADLRTPEFLDMCEKRGQGRLWTLALAKVPKAIRDDPRYKPLDASMRRTMGELPQSIVQELSYVETLAKYAEAVSMYDEFRGQVEYRYADFPLAVGEAIMLNHALYGSLLYAQATPLTDDPFHQQVLDLKLRRAEYLPEIRQIVEDRARERQIKKDLLAGRALTDVDLAVLSPKLQLDEILKFREDNKDTLTELREELGLMARQIRSQPWTKEFEDCLESDTLPKLQKSMKDGFKARDGWLKGGRGKLALKAAGLTFGAAAAVITLATAATPLLPVAVAATAFGMLGDNVIPGVELVMDWRKGKKAAEENGLNYLIKFKHGFGE